MSLKPVTNARFIRDHGDWAQEVANATNSPTDLYRDHHDGPALTLRGWPRRGKYMQTFWPVRLAVQPRPSQPARPAAAQEARS